LVWWWKGEASFVVILKDLQIADQNFEVNWVPLSEMISEGSPWIRKILFIKAEAVSVAEGTLGNGIKWLILVNLSVTTKIQV